MKLNSAVDAIKQAIEGGYDGDEQYLLSLPEYAHNQIWCDPLFWQALGKARGWRCDMEENPDLYDEVYCKKTGEFYAIRWFETRLSNGDETKFWQNLP